MTVPSLATSELPSLRAALESPDTSGFDLVYLAMKALYVTNESSLRLKVEDMTEKLEEMDKLSKIQRAFSNAAESGVDTTLSTMLSDAEALGFETSDIQDTSMDGGAAPIGTRIDLGDNRYLDIYFADDQGTEGFNEQTGTVTVTTEATDDAEATTTEYGFGFTDENKDDAERGAVFRAVLFENGVETKEILSYKNEFGIMVTEVYDLEIDTGSETDLVGDNRFINRTSGEGSSPEIIKNLAVDPETGFKKENPHNVRVKRPDGFINTSGDVIRRDLTSYDTYTSSSNTNTFALDLGDVTIEFGLKGGALSGFGIMREGEAMGINANIQSPGVPMTAAPELMSVESGRLDQERETSTDDSPHDQGDSYDAQNQSNEAALADMGITDENGTGNLLDDFGDYLVNELGMDPKFLEDGVLTSSDMTQISEAAEAKIDSLTSMNQIDMLNLERAFNNLNVIVTTLSNVQAGFNRALTTVANNMA